VRHFQPHATVAKAAKEEAIAGVFQGAGQSLSSVTQSRRSQERKPNTNTPNQFENQPSHLRSK
jgi:hypothetical protein